MDRPRMRVSSVVLGAADPKALADFYHRLLGWEITEQYPARPGLPPQDGWQCCGHRPASPGSGALPSSGNPTTCPRPGRRYPGSRK